MKSVIQSLTLAAALAVPVAVFAQTNAPVTRAQVRAELVQMEHAGYSPSRLDNANYPDGVQAAEAKAAAANNATGVGGAANGSSDAGGHAAVNAPDHSLFSHH